MSKSRRAADLLATVAAFLECRQPLDFPLWVGLSGGRDSVVLLHALAALYPGRVAAIHVHHGLSRHADQWTAFCESFCDGLRIPLTVHRVTVSPDGRGVEDAARKARYDAYASLGRGCLLLAHHQDDQAETLLFNLLRGAGVTGLAGMAPERRHGDLRVLRPLLQMPGAWLQDYALAHQLTWIEDDSNQDEGFSRNYLRHRVMLVIEARFPGGAEAMARAARHCAETDGLLNTLASLDQQAVTTADGGMDLSCWRQLDPARQKNLIRALLRARGVHSMETPVLAALLVQLAQVGVDNRMAFHHESLVFRVMDGQVWCLPAQWFSQPPVVWRGEAELPWAGGRLAFSVQPGGLSREKLQGREVSFRYRQGGERWPDAGGEASQSLKHVLQARRLPQRIRACLPLGFVEDTLVWCHGLGVAPGWDAREAPGWAITWQPPAFGQP